MFISQSYAYVFDSVRSMRVIIWLSFSPTYALVTVFMLSTRNICLVVVIRLVRPKINLRVCVSGLKIYHPARWGLAYNRLPTSLGRAPRNTSDILSIDEELFQQRRQLGTPSSTPTRVPSSFCSKLPSSLGMGLTYLRHVQEGDAPSLFFPQKIRKCDVHKT